MKPFSRPTRRAFAVWAVAAAAGLAMTGPVRAQATSTKPLEQATSTDLVEQLAPAKVSARSLRNITPERRQVDLLVNFDFDSDRLQPHSRPLLQSLAEAMNSARLQELRFLVEGHTDAKGTPRYNEELSARRALSVVQFLQANGVAFDRLVPRGKGSSELLNRDQPDASENRRVRIITITQ